MIRRYFVCILLASLLAGCNLPTGSQNLPTPTDDPISTQVSQLLTGIPTATLLATSAFTETPSPTETASAPTGTPTPTEAAATAAIAQPTATTPAGDPKNSLGAPSWHNSLDDSKLFYLYENDNTRVTHADGALLLTGISANGWLGWSLTFNKPSKNFYLEATFNPQQCSGSDLYGLIFRVPETDSGYFYSVTCDGKYDLHARDFADGSDFTKIERTASSAIQAGSNAVNRLGVMANGEKISLYANGVLLQEVNDNTFLGEGNFGALVAANATNGFTVRMDEISLWSLP